MMTDDERRLLELVIRLKREAEEDDTRIVNLSIYAYTTTFIIISLIIIIGIWSFQQ
jgi:hypothetical protein